MLESAPPATRGETTPNALKSLRDSLRGSFSSLEQKLSATQRPGGAPLAPTVFPSLKKFEAAPGALPSPTNTHSAVFSAQGGKQAPRSAPVLPAFASPRSLEARTTQRTPGEARTTQRTPGSAPGGSRSQAWPSIAPQASEPVARPASAFASAYMLAAQKSEPNQTGSGTATRSGPDPLSPTSAMVRRLETIPRPGFKVGAAPTLGTVTVGPAAAPSPAPAPAGFTPRSIDSTTFQRFAPARAEQLHPGAGPTAGTTSATPMSGPEKSSPAKFEPENGLAVSAPGVSPKPGTVSSTSALRGRAAQLQDMSTLPDISGRRASQKAQSGTTDSEKIKKSPWGNDKAIHEVVDKLSELIQVVKQQGA